MILDALGNVFRIPDLRRRVIFTASILALLQFGMFVPIPGIDIRALQAFTSQSDAMGKGVFNLLDLFSGGAFRQCSVFALGIMPYISASIILQLLTVVSPQLEQISKSGEEGRRKINQWTRYMTVGITIFQAFMLSFAIQSWTAPSPSGNVPLVVDLGWSFNILCAVAMTTGTMVIMWMGEQITERGIGNGISLIIFANIVNRLPQAVARGFWYISTNNPRFTALDALGTLVIFLIIIWIIVTIQFGVRKVPIHRGRMMTRLRGSQHFLPIRVNTAGVIPVIFASSILILPATFQQFTGGLQASENFGWVNWALNWLSEQLMPGYWLYTLLTIVLIVFFSFFYTAITFNPKDVSDNLKKSGTTVPGKQPGKKTEEYLEGILNRVTWGGACFLAFVAVLPDVVSAWLDIPNDISSFLGGTSLIIVVGVALDTVNQVENHLRVRNYDGFRRRGRVRGRSGM